MSTKWEKMDAAELVDAERIMVRTNELLAGSKLQFNQNEMEAALDAFVDFKRISRSFFGDPRDYLQSTGIRSLYGSPFCGDCGDITFDSERKYANHMMSLQHFLTMHRTTLPAIREVRAHLQAYPIDPDLFWKSHYFKQAKSVYKFIGLPS